MHRLSNEDSVAFSLKVLEKFDYFLVILLSDHGQKLPMFH